MGKIAFIAGALALAFGVAAASEVLAVAQDADWSEGSSIASGGRANPHAFFGEEFAEQNAAGRAHTLVYPVTVTGALVPDAPFRRLFDEGARNPLRAFLARIVRQFGGFDSTDDVFSWLGLHEYPAPDATGVYAIARPPGLGSRDRMGYGRISREGAEGFTFSCAACHASNLFGRPVLGLTNRFPRANELFILAKRATAAVTPPLFATGTGANAAERRMYAGLRRSIGAVGVRQPLALGLDTSLAQVALSLAHRAPDEDASRSREFERAPRPDILDSQPADSKPAVWWNLKYKNRWLSDGSVVSGNPILTNLLWNEIGRGTDLRRLGDWLEQNGRVITELTTAVFSSEAPRFTDFFPADRIDLARARRGERIFNDRCARCHGTYEKAWNRVDAEALSASERLATTSVRYPERTKVIDVGTDSMRYLGMTSLAEKLNPLAISRRYGIRITPQKGYVPPPLVGIWARWPYFHNNSIPTLCDLLTPTRNRPVSYRAGPALDRDRDFDSSCNGYPASARVPSGWLANDETLFETNRIGMSNAGHDEGIIEKGGRALIGEDEKSDLIIFLQTL